jgi:hypothetical protein
VIALAEDESLPVLERAKFLAIASRNLDHFFQVRVAGLKTQIAAEVGALSIDGRSPADQLAAIRPLVIEQMARLDEILRKDLAPRPARSGNPPARLGRARSRANTTSCRFCSSRGSSRCSRRSRSIRRTRFPTSRTCR